MHAVTAIFLLIIAMVLAFAAAIAGLVWGLATHWSHLALHLWMIGLGLPIGIGILVYLLWLSKRIQRNVILRKAMTNPSLLLVKWVDDKNRKITITKEALFIDFQCFLYNSFNNKLTKIEIRESSPAQYDFYFEFLQLANYNGSRTTHSFPIPPSLLEKCRAAKEVIIPNS